MASLTDSVLPRWLVLIIAVLCGAPLALVATGSTPLVWTASELPPGAELYIVLEWTAHLSALATAFGAITYFRARDDLVTAVIGMMLLGAGLIDGFAVCVAAGWLHVPASTADVVPFLWWLSRLFCAAALTGGAAFAVYWARRERPPATFSVFLLMSTMFLAVAASLVFVAVAPALPQTLAQEGLVPHPLELLPLALFLIAGAYLLPKLNRIHPSTFDQALVVSVVPHMAAQLYMGLGSEHLFDTSFHLAQFLKVFGYVIPLIGLSLDYIRVYQQEASTLDGLRGSEEALRRSRELYRTLARHLPDSAVFLFDTNLRYLLAEGTVIGRLGHSPDDFEGRTLFEVESSQASEALGPAFRAALTGTASDLEYSTLGYVFQVHVIPVRDAHNEVVAGMAVLRDITEQRQAERSLRLTQFSVEQAMDAVTWLDDMGHLLFANEALCRYLGYSSDELLALTIYDIDPDINEDSWPDRWRTVRDRGRLSLEGHLRARDGRLIPVDMNIRHLEFDGRSYQAAFVRDISERVIQARLRTEKEAAEAANRAKSQFLAHMSHELRTPLNSVIGFANILLKNKKENLLPKDMTYLSRIRDNGSHLLSLINDVLDLSKVEAGKMPILVESVDVATLIAEVTLQLAVQLKDKPVELRTEIVPGLPAIHTDGAKLRQTIINLVGNAIKFTHEGSITVRLRPHTGERGRLRLEVEDTGIGIPKDRLAAIFEPFAQAEETTSRRFGGTGLGLTITKKMLELLGHRLEVDSVEGEGSTFRVILRRTRRRGGTDSTQHTPRVTMHTEVMAVAPTGQLPLVDIPGAQDSLVLVVDDNADARLLLGSAFEEFGCRVVTASSGRDGLRMARELQPDIIVLDLMMGELGGKEALDEIGADTMISVIPVVIVSFVGSEHRDKLQEADVIIDKPATREALHAALTKCLASPRQRLLVVDDDELVRQYLSALLADEGFQVRVAANGEEALRVLERVPADMVVVDLAMPVMDGFGFLGAVRANDKLVDLPVVVITGRDLTNVEQRFLEQEAIAVLTKGRDMGNHLLAVVRKRSE